MTHTPGDNGCHDGVESTCPNCSPLAKQFAADAAAAEAAWQAFATPEFLAAMRAAVEDEN